MDAYKSWIRRVFLFAGSALLTVGAFNLLVDPYDIYRLLTVPGFNANKHMALDHSRMIKPYLVKVLRPAGLAMGTSRTEIGIDPEHPGWSEKARPVFNFGLGGARIREVLEHLARVAKLHPPRQVVLGLDMFMFNAYLDRGGGQNREGEVETSALAYHVSALLTVEALADSIDTLRKQDPVCFPGYLRNGQIAPTFNTHRLRWKGQRNTFQRAERHYFDSVFFPPPEREFCFIDPETSRETFHYFREIVALARDQGIDLKLYIAPIHARLSEVMVQGGIWPLFEDWKRELVAILAEDARNHPDQPPLILWDFSGYNPVTTEEVPEPGDKENFMDFYWEGSHFKTEAGDLMLDRIFAYRSGERRVPNGFGVPIHAGNIEDHLAEIRRQQEKYRQAHPAEVAEVAEIARSFSFLQ